MADIDFDFDRKRVNAGYRAGKYTSEQALLPRCHFVQCTTWGIKKRDFSSPSSR